MMSRTHGPAPVPWYHRRGVRRAAVGLAFLLWLVAAISLGALDPLRAGAWFFAGYGLLWALLALQMWSRFGWRPGQHLDERQLALLGRVRAFEGVLVASGVGGVIGAAIGEAQGAGVWPGFFDLRFSMAQMLAVLVLVLGSAVLGLAWHEADPLLDDA